MSDEKSNNQSGMCRRDFFNTAGIAAGAAGLFAQSAFAAGNRKEPGDCRKARKKIKICFIGGGSQIWAPRILRDIVFKEGLENVEMEVALLDIHLGRATAMHNLFKAKFREWGVTHIHIYPTSDPVEALADSDFILITISTGRLEAMRYDIEVPEKYGIFHTVGDTCGPGGWARALRNIPVFQKYAQQIKQLAPNAYVLNYTNPMGALTKVLIRELGPERVVGLCHGLFECYDLIQKIFRLPSEKSIYVRFGGVNHFFWILDLKIDGQDGYRMLRDRLGNKSLSTLIQGVQDDIGHGSNLGICDELFANYGYLPYVADRHTSEFFGCYITNKAMMDRYKLVRTSIADREKMYATAAANIEKWTHSEGGLDKTPSRETAADMIRAILYNESIIDVVNLVNTGQIPSLPIGAVVETLGQVGGGGFTPLACGALPETINTLVRPHAEVQVRTVEAALAGDLNAALLALAEDPACINLSISQIKKMGMEMLEPNRQYMPNLFKI